MRIDDLKRNDYVSSLRYRLLAEMFYLTGDIERYGTGYVHIREYLGKFPKITLTVEEIGDSFKVELRQVTELLSLLVRQPMSHSDLQAAMGFKQREHFLAEYLQPALQSGLIAMTNPDNSRASNQLYGITEKGRRSNCTSGIRN